jgi:mannobiose 2-epimerase
MKTDFAKRVSAIAAIFIIVLITCCFKADDKPKQRTDFETDKKLISSEMERVLDYDFDLWYPLSIDTVYGGFFSDINYKWELQGRQMKMIVTQARHVWSNSNAALYFKDKEKYLNVAEHGFEFLKNKMWDNVYGGFFNLVDREGKAQKENGEIIKRAYGNSFALYGLAAYYKASGKEEALQLAKKTFDWFEKHSYDPEYGGYFQFVSRDGKPFTDGYDGVPPKDQNTLIHILESFTELYKVWPNPLLKERLNSLLHIIRDTIVTPTGYMQLFFKRDWTPISFRNSSNNEREKNYEFDHVSFGHDVEIAYLMLETSEALGKKNDSTTLRIAKKLVDHSLINGFDYTNGGIFDRGYYFKGDDKLTIIQNTKEWWSQAEALNSFLMMSELFPNDKFDYYQKFCWQWDYIKKFVIDNEYGGWYWGGIDIVPANKTVPQASIWKGNYHTSRALINCLRRIEELKNSQ